MLWICGLAVPCFGWRRCLFFAISWWSCCWCCRWFVVGRLSGCCRLVVAVSLPGCCSVAAVSLLVCWCGLCLVTWVLVFPPFRGNVWIVAPLSVRGAGCVPPLGGGVDGGVGGEWAWNQESRIRTVFSVSCHPCPVGPGVCVRIRTASGTESGHRPSARTRWDGF